MATLQYSGLEISVDYRFRGVAKSRTRLSDFHFTAQSFMFPSGFTFTVSLEANITKEEARVYFSI